MAGNEEYEIQLHYITRRNVQAESPEEALESISEDEIESGELRLSNIDVLDEDGQVVSQEMFDAAFGD